MTITVKTIGSPFIVSFVLLLLYSLSARGQTCLQLLDSIEFYKSQQREKTMFYGLALMEKLDRGECNLDIGLIAVYNNLGVAFWEAKDQPNARYAFGMSIAYSPTDSINPPMLARVCNACIMLIILLPIIRLFLRNPLPNYTSNELAHPQSRSPLDCGEYR